MINKVDSITHINSSLIQHGPHNNRIYLMHLGGEEPEGLIVELDGLARAEGYTKIFAKIPARAWSAFQKAGYVKEAMVPGFFAGRDDGLFIAKYFSSQREKEAEGPAIPAPADQAPPGRAENKIPANRPKLDIFPCQPAHAKEMAALFQQVFDTYPFPIQNPAYLTEMMQQGFYYLGVRIKDRIAALAAAEIDPANRHAEMTDFAVLPSWRGMGLAGLLLGHLENESKKQGVKTSYTIARAESFSMNAVFKNHGYSYGGLLKNNSQICGSIQSMTVWFKPL